MNNYKEKIDIPSTTYLISREYWLPIIDHLRKFGTVDFIDSNNQTTMKDLYTAFYVVAFKDPDNLTIVITGKNEVHKKEAGSDAQKLSLLEETERTMMCRKILE